MIRFVRLLAIAVFTLSAFGQQIQSPSQFLKLDIGKDRVLADYAQIKSYFRGESEEVGGILPLIPLVMIGTLVALKLRTQEEPESRAAVLVLAAGWLALLGVATCWFASARYEADFMLLIATGAVVCIERGLALQSRPLRIVTIALASATILLGLLLGFEGTGGELEKRNPEVFRMFADRFR